MYFYSIATVSTVQSQFSSLYIAVTAVSAAEQECANVVHDSMC